MLPRVRFRFSLKDVLALMSTNIHVMLIHFMMILSPERKFVSLISKKNELTKHDVIKFLTTVKRVAHQLIAALMSSDYNYIYIFSLS